MIDVSTFRPKRIYPAAENLASGYYHLALQVVRTYVRRPNGLLRIT